MLTVGIDEVGRGCWAGPLVAGAVILPPDRMPEDGVIQIRDSKRLSKKQRDIAAIWIHDNALAIGLGWVTPSEVDKLGLTESVRLAMHRAYVEIAVPHDEVIIDGNINYFAGNPRARAVVQADGSVPSVSAASIVAKVARDKYMSELSKQYAGYGFENHVGYGTAAHIAALKALGVSDVHRHSYKPIRAFLTV